jgi:hypothetical protein
MKKGTKEIRARRDSQLAATQPVYNLFVTPVERSAGLWPAATRRGNPLGNTPKSSGLPARLRSRVVSTWFRVKFGISAMKNKKTNHPIEFALIGEIRENLLFSAPSASSCSSRNLC